MSGRDADTYPIEPPVSRAEPIPVVAAPASPAPAMPKACECVVCVLRRKAMQAVPEAMFFATPLSVNLIGIRREASIASDKFDDLMAIFFLLPDPKADKERFEQAVEKALCQDIEDAAAALKDPLIRVVQCTNGGSRRWVLGLFALSTDAGLAQRGDLRSQLEGAKTQRKAAQAALEDVKKTEEELKKLGEDWKDKAKALAPKKGGPAPKPEELAKVKSEVQELQRSLSNAYDAAHGRPRSSALEAAIKWLNDQEKRLQELEAKNPAAAGAGRAQAMAKFDEKLKADENDQAEQIVTADRSIKERQPAVTSLDAGEVPSGFSKHYHRVMQVDDGWAGDGRALFPVGFYPNHFRFGLHGGDGLYSSEWEKAQAALQVWHGSPASVSFDGRRVCTGALFRKYYRALMNFDDPWPVIASLQRVGEKKPTQFTAPYPVLEVWRTKDGPRHLLNSWNTITPLNGADLVWSGRVPVKVETVAAGAAEAPRRFRVREIRAKGKPARVVGAAESAFIVLERTDDGPTIDAWLEEGGKRTKPDDEDQFVLEARIGATNIHRAHNVKVSDTDGSVTLGGEGEIVSNWSTGCQVFQRFADFNLFIRLCAMSKRWTCAQGAGWPPAPSPTADVKDARRKAADARKAAKTAEGKAKELENALAKKKKGVTAEAVEKAKADASTARENVTKAEAEVTTAEQGDVDLLGGCCRIEKGAGGDAGKGGRQIAKLWNVDAEAKKTAILQKAGYFMHDWMRVCDLGGWCKVRFNYTLIELDPGTIVDLQDDFSRVVEKNPVNPRWMGKLLG
jgi:hypothetical protein